MFTICESRTIQMTQNCKNSKCLQILAEEDFPLKLLWRTPIKVHWRADRRRQPRSREHHLAQRRQRRQRSTTNITKACSGKITQLHCIKTKPNEREHQLPTLPKAMRLDQTTLKVYRQNYLLRCSDRQQKFMHIKNIFP